MKVIYTPKDGDSQEFTAVRLDELLSIHTEPIEEVGGSVWHDWPSFRVALLVENKGRAKRALLWHLLRQQRPELTFVELVVGPDDISLQEDAEDIRRARELVMTSGSEEERADFVEMYGEGKDEADAATTDSVSPAPASEA